jgi:hypothetical protein
VRHDHSIDDPPFPAVTIEKGGEEWIVGLKELVPPVANDEGLRAEYMKCKLVPEIVAAYDSGCLTVREIAVKLGVQMIDVLSRYRKAKKLGLLKEKSHEQN